MVPLPMELVGREVGCRHVGIGDLDTRGVGIGIDGAPSPRFAAILASRTSGSVRSGHRPHYAGAVGAILADHALG